MQRALHSRNQRQLKLLALKTTACKNTLAALAARSMQTASKQHHRYVEQPFWARTSKNTLAARVAGFKFKQLAGHHWQFTLLSLMQTAYKQHQRQFMPSALRANIFKETLVHFSDGKNPPAGRGELVKGCRAHTWGSPLSWMHIPQGWA